MQEPVAGPEGRKTEVVVGCSSKGSILGRDG